MFLCGYYQKTCIRKFLLLVLAVIMLVCSYHTYAQSAPTDTSNGVVVNESPCEPVKGTYENYVDALKKRYTTEYEAARRKAVPMQPVERFVHALYTREEFEKRKAHQGFECLRVAYMSDGLKVVGYIYKPQDTNGKHYPLIRACRINGR